MRNYLVLAVSLDDNKNPVITNQGQIEEQVGDMFVVILNVPAKHRRILSAAALSPFALFENSNEAVAYLQAITPQPAASSQELPQTAIAEPEEAVKRDESVAVVGE